MKNLAVSLLLVVLSLSSTFSQSYTVESVPNVKLIDNSYVSNPDNILSQNTVTVINHQLTNLEQKNSDQVAVVMLNSIGEADIFDFAQELFNKWGIGAAGKNNGLLILFVKDKRTIRFHTGKGLEMIVRTEIVGEVGKAVEVGKAAVGNPLLI